MSDFEYEQWESKCNLKVYHYALLISIILRQG